MIPVVVLFSIALAIEPSFSYPLGGFADTAQAFDVSTNFDAYTGPWNYGNRWWGGNGGFWGGNGGFWGGNGGFLSGNGGFLSGNGGFLSGNGGFWSGSRGLSDGLVEFDVDYGYNYGNPTRTIDVGRRRVVPDFAVTETDNYISDRKTYRLPPRYQYVSASPRRVFAYGTPRTSIRTGGDPFLLNR